MNTEIKGYGGRPVVMGGLKDYLPIECKIKNGVFSRMEIKNHMEKFGVDLSLCKGQSPNDYENFSDYLSREFNDGVRPIDGCPGGLLSPCDGLLTAHFINSFAMIPMDGYMYSISKLLGNSAAAREFAEGIALVIRLTDIDPHRFIYVDNGVVCESEFVKADKNNENTGLFGARYYSLLKTENFYNIAQVEICGNAKGIEQFGEPENMAFSRGQQKGRFLCDNAAVVLLFKKGVMHPDDEFMVNTGLDKETRVRMGERIGYAIMH